MLLYICELTGNGRLISLSDGTQWRVDEDDLIRAVPEDRLLVESDSPYLAPMPNRGRRNEPAWVSFTVARVAAARGVESETIAAATRRNTIRLFGLSIPSESKS